MNPSLRRMIFAASILALVTTMGCSDPPRSADEEAIIRTAQTLFDAMYSGDRELAASLFTPEAKMIGLPEDSLGRISPRFMSAKDWTGGLPEEEGRYRERMFDPIVHIDDNMAVLWTYYEFWLRGEFSHCGVDAFELVKVDGKWLIFSVVDTRRQEGCEDRGASE